jgi:hypothetical protein
MFDPFKNDNFITQKKIDSPPSLTIPKAFPLKISFKELIEAQHLSSSQQKQQEDKIFKFDQEVFTDCQASESDETSQINIFKLMNKLAVEDLVMTEMDFIRYCTKLYGIKKKF